MTAVSKDEWRRGIALERRDWEKLAWQRTPRERRVSEWERHLSALGLSLRSFSGQAVLDVGCGPTGAVYFLEASRRVGLDPLADRYEDWNGFWGERAELIQSPAETMPFLDGEFDSVLCINCLDHTCDPEAVLAEIARVLKPGGTLVLHVDLDSPFRRLHKRVRPVARTMHPHSLSHQWLLQRLAAGFEIEVEQRDPEVFRPNRRQMRYEAFWDGLMYRLTRGSDTWMNHVWLRGTRLHTDG